MTSRDCASGTDRVAEVARKMPQAEILVNVQGDEPEMSPDNIDRVIELLEQDPSAGMATLATPMPSAEQLANPACVKVVFDDAGRAHVLQPQPDSVCPRSGHQPAVQRSAAVSISTWAFTRIAARCCWKFAAMPPSSLEQAEKLEQLRMLQTGGTILVAVVDHAASGIDTPADYAAFVARRRAAG